jgi:hypothetical protein
MPSAAAAAAPWPAATRHLSLSESDDDSDDDRSRTTTTEETTNKRPRAADMAADERRAAASNETPPAAPTAPLTEQIRSTADVINAIDSVPVYSIAQARGSFVDFMSETLINRETIGLLYNAAGLGPWSRAPRSSEREALLLIAERIFPSAPEPAAEPAPEPAAEPAAEPTVS